MSAGRSAATTAVTAQRMLDSCCVGEWSGIDDTKVRKPFQKYNPAEQSLEGEASHACVYAFTSSQGCDRPTL